MKILYVICMCLVIVCLARAAQSVEVKTSDGLCLRLADQTGFVEAIDIRGEQLPLLQSSLPLRVRELTPPVLDKNLVPNPGLELGEAAPTAWPNLGQGAARVSEFNHTPNGKYCGKVTAPADASESAPASSGQFRGVNVPAKPNTLYLFRAWGLVPERSSGGNAFVVELDNKGNIIWEGKYHVQHSMGWREKTEGKWVQKETSFVTKPNCAQFHIYANIWKGHGLFYFDDIELFDLADCWKDVALPPAPVEVCADGKGWRQKTSSADGNLAVELSYLALKDHIRIEATVQDTHQPIKERALQMRFVLPIDATGWTWHDDGRRCRAVAAGKTPYDNSFAVAGGRMSRYPFTSLTKEEIGLSLGAPMDCPRLQNFAYDPSQGYMTAVDVGLSPFTKRIGAGRAIFTTIVFQHDGEWGLRAAARKYYDIFPEYFAKRAQREGLWFYAVPVRPIPNPEDFGLTFYEGYPGKPEDRAYAREKGIYILPYTEPWGARQVFPKAATKEDLPPYEERLAILKQWASDKDPKLKFMGGPRWEVAQAILNSLPYDTNGLAPFSVDKYGTWAQWWRTNTNPFLPAPNRSATCKKYEIDPVLPEADGIYLDSVSFWLGNYLNYRQEHFSEAEIPPAFDCFTARPALLGMFSHCEFINWLAQELHKQGKLVHMNIFGESYRFCAHLADVLGSEVSSQWGKGARNLSEIESDEVSLARRMLAYRKPTSNLLQEGNFNTPRPELSQAEVEQYIKHQMFYGFFPGIATIGGEEKPGYIGWKRYFGTPAQYERDRTLFKKYIPIIKEVCAAGWEPVTCARTSSENVYIERFGYWDKSNLHFTLRNNGEKEERFSVTIQAGRLGAAGKELGDISVRELASNSLLAANTNDKTVVLELSMVLPPKETAVLQIERRRE